MGVIDESFFNVLNGLAGKSLLFDGAVVFFGSPAIFIFALVIIFIFLHEESMRDLWWHTKTLVLALIAGSLFEWFVRIFYDRPRPFEIVNIMPQLLHHVPGYSFPSSHALFAFIFATLITFWKPRWSVPMFLFAGLIAISRVIGGVHWPSDVVGGAVMGILSTIFVCSILRKKEN